MTAEMAYFKPVGGGAADSDVAVLREAFHLPQAPGEICPVELSEARELIGASREGEFLGRISSGFQAISRGKEFVVLEGLHGQAGFSTLDLETNALVAAHLRVPVLLVARGHAGGSPDDIDQIVTSVLTAKRSFETRDIEVLGVVVNRVAEAGLAELRRDLSAAFRKAGVNLYGVVPNLDFLGYPKLDQIAAELNATVLIGGNVLDRVAGRTIVAAMEPRNFIKHLTTDRTLVVAPGDREDILLALACTQQSPTRHSISGVVLTGGLRPDPEIVRLLDETSRPGFPLLAVETDTFTTAMRISTMDVRVRPQDEDKIFAAISGVSTHVEHEHLWEALEIPRPKRCRGGADSFLEDILARARRSGKRIVLPEGDEPRTVRAVGKLLELDVCPVTLLGDPERILAVAKEAGVRIEGRANIINPRTSPDFDRYADMVVEARKGKRGGITPEVARQWLTESTINFGTVMVKCGQADGLVSGATHSTADTIRPALQIIGVEPGIGLASSIFFMALKDRVLVYGDCAIVPNPNAEELAGIAMAAAKTARAFGLTPRVAMLSYSTGKSGTGESVDKVTLATQLVRDRNPNFLIDGPLQYDAAIDPDVGKLKQPNSPVAGQANVFIFPDLDAGNIAYKAVQRSAGVLAVGPIMQGLNMPVNDLSRGCTVDDIVYTVAVTAIQAVHTKGA
jgi:phosphate acetyltransferase